MFEESFNGEIQSDARRRSQGEIVFGCFSESGKTGMAGLYEAFYYFTEEGLHYLKCRRNGYPDEN